MLKKIMHRIGIGLCGVLAATTAGAANITWDFGSSTEAATNAGTFGNTRLKTVSGVTATASAWSSTADGSSGANTVIQDAYLGLYGGGLGVTNRDGSTTATASNCSSIAGGGDNCEGAPGVVITAEHATDNNQRYDSVRIKFGTAVNLTSITLGYVNTDSDVTILASNGAPLGSQTYGGVTGLVGAGWTLVGNFADVAQGVASSISNALNKTDWLILAYSPGFGANLSGGNDHFKLQAVTGSSTQVPEPGTLLLLGAALAGIWSRRRVARR